MGKKNYAKTDISKSKTDALGIESLLVIDSDSDDTCYHTIHKRYFSNEKCICPTCRSTNTRTSKWNIRKFKDIIVRSNKDFTIIDLVFHQRYYRCNDCEKKFYQNNIFPEDIDFAERRSRFTNRLSDKLALGTLRYSYKKVCNYYGVPASTASVGCIMRRQMKNQEAKFSPFETPSILVILELEYWGQIYPLILGIYNDQIFCMDILNDTTEASYIAFFRNLDSSKVQHIFIEPTEELRNAAVYSFPAVEPIISEECIYRHGRNALIKIIKSDGKRFPLKRKEDKLTQNKKYITSRLERRNIRQGMSTREHLKKAYDHYQALLNLFDGEWEYSQLHEWGNNTPGDIQEFIELVDIIEVYENEIQNYITNKNLLPEKFSAVVEDICTTITSIPHCIFDVLRARCLLTSKNDIVKDDETIRRLGIPAERFISNIKELTENIKEEREYGLE